MRWGNNKTVGEIDCVSRNAGVCVDEGNKSIYAHLPQGMDTGGLGNQAHVFTLVVFVNMFLLHNPDGT